MSNPAGLRQTAGSDLERALRFYLRAEKLPTPEAEFRFHHTRRWRFDLAYPELKIGIEVEGGQWSGGRHVRGKGFENDCEKYSEAAIAGWLVLRFTGNQIESGYATEAVRRALDSRRTPEAPWWSKP